MTRLALFVAYAWAVNLSVEVIFDRPVLVSFHNKIFEAEVLGNDTLRVLLIGK